ncbi:P-loop containing nucleoside triphosphate hydrolase protein [Wilcoxina mikolae CBS 423.85]|nr:P-loop containing nucleoside triphosphate hydrolase protein [Wilcoxina mikolae CBS 423.85]
MSTGRASRAGGSGAYRTSSSGTAPVPPPDPNDFEHVQHDSTSTSTSGSPPPPPPLYTTGIQELGSEEQTSIINLIESVRESGVSKHIHLPQLVICGDQSSGKSTVMQAITEIPFPHSTGQCTKFATEVILRRADYDEVAIGVKPFRAGEIKKMDTSSVTSMQDLSEVILNAGDMMEFIGDTKSFSRDVLQIEISGPTRTPLILVDLPGLIHTGDDEAVVSALVDEYMENPRTIILAVVTASNHNDLQGVLKKVKNFDPKGLRTLGIITKPDKTDKGTELESKFINLAQNLDETYHFKLGWHVVMNGDAKDNNERIDLRKRENDEKKFFGSGTWSGIAKGHCCIGPLRSRLSNLLLNHVKRELKGVKEDIGAAIDGCKKEIADMGELHMTRDSQRKYLVTLGKKYNHLCMQAVWGIYADAGFFGNGFSSAPDDEARFLRARIQNLNITFARTFWKYGHHKEIEDYSLMPATSMNEDEPKSHFDNCRVRPDEITRKYAIVDWVKPVAVRTRGFELADGRNPVLVKMLFCEQSQKWETLAFRHLEECSQACRRFLRLVLEAVVPQGQAEVREALHDWIETVLERRLENAKRELESIINDCRGRFPITNNYQYMDDVNMARAARDVSSSGRYVNITRTLGRLTTFPGRDEILNEVSDLISSLDSMGDNPSDPEDLKCEASLDEMLAYYKTARRRFVDDVVVQVIERQLASELCDIFSSSQAAEMPEDEVAYIAEESDEKKRKLDDLQSRLISLKAAAAACRKYARCQDLND